LPLRAVLRVLLCRRLAAIMYHAKARVSGGRVLLRSLLDAPSPFQSG